MSAILTLTNTPTIENAKEIARHLVTHRLCACVNIMSKCHSIYHWQEAVEESEEYTLLIKTNTNKYSTIEKEIQKLHKYEVPEIIAFDIKHGLANYLTWINEVVS